MSVNEIPMSQVETKFKVAAQYGILSQEDDGNLTSSTKLGILWSIVTIAWKIQVFIFNYMEDTIIVLGKRAHPKVLRRASSPDVHAQKKCPPN